MCDYSLTSVQNRLAVTGEQLVVRRFPMSCLGLSSVADIEKARACRAAPACGLRQRLGRLLWPPEVPDPPAVCVPPGARLLLQDLPEWWQRKLHLQSAEQEVVFTQLDTVGYRDAVRFANGHVLLLQRLTEGQRVRVLALSSEEAAEQERDAARVRENLSARVLA